MQQDQKLEDFQIHEMIRSKVASTLLLAASATAKIFYAGVSESGGEFGVYSATAVNGTGLPGR